jgi:hypothetical protein
MDRHDHLNRLDFWLDTFGYLTNDQKTLKIRKAGTGWGVMVQSFPKKCICKKLRCECNMLVSAADTTLDGALLKLTNKLVQFELESEESNGNQKHEASTAREAR